MRDQLTLAREGVRALAVMGKDAAGSIVGRGLPLAPTALTRPATFAALLTDQADGVEELPLRPMSVSATDIVAPSSNCQNTIFEVTWEGAADDPGSADGSMPATLFVKQPTAHFPTRLFANLIGFWNTECAVCRNLSSRLSIATPRVHAVVQSGGRFVLVMENLLERPDTRLFVNRDFLDGADVPRAQRCLTTLARLHADMTGLGPGERELLLPLDLHPFLSPSIAPITSVVNRLAAGRCHKRAPETFGAADADLFRRALDHWETLAETWYREPLTLVHGDSHLGNFFETGGEIGMIDFQGAHWGKGIRDVNYFLVNSMRPDLLAEHEEELVAGYCGESTTLGAPLSFEEGFDQYRGFTFQTLMTAVVSLGLGSFTDSAEVMQAMLERSVAATRRLDFEGWLDAQIEQAADRPGHQGSTSS